MISFVRKDLEILQSTHQVRGFQYRGIRNILFLIRCMLWADVTFSWFGKLHAFWSVLFSKFLGKKSIVVAGGDDVANEPEIKYGMFPYWWKRWCPLFVFRFADLILSVSRFNHRETIVYARTNPKKLKLLYHGFDAQKWQRLECVRKENLVLSVGRITNETFRKKGLDLFVRSASFLPGVHFVMVGPWHDSAIDRLREIAPPNVKFTGGMYGEHLVRMYSRAKVYVQASVHESFGCSVAEAMLCECVPVVSRRAALPEVVGNCGFYVNELTPAAVAAQINKALVSDLGHKARERIIRDFPFENRRRVLLALISELVGY